VKNEWSVISITPLLDSYLWMDWCFD
jgi:hypothetical protein